MKEKKVNLKDIQAVRKEEKEEKKKDEEEKEKEIN